MRIILLHDPVFATVSTILFQGRAILGNPLAWVFVRLLSLDHDLATAYYVSDRIAIMFRGNIVEMGTVEQVLMNPRHPYSKLLRDSIAQADPNKRWTTDVTLAELEQEEYLRRGCKFAGRCPDVMDICKGVVPADIGIDDVLVKCHLYAGELKAAQPASE